jgi:hypothetical protein
VVAKAFVSALVLAASACGTAASGNAAIQADFADHRSNTEVTADGQVTRLLSDEHGPDGTHQRFIVQLSGLTQTVLIDNNIDIGRRAAVVAGDAVTVHGEYVWNDQGGLIHFTHHDPAHTHEGGWIEAKGVRYE